MADERKHDDVEKVLADQQALEARRKLVIDDLLKQRANAVKAFDEKLAKLGYKSNDGRPRKSHHKRPAPVDKQAAAVDANPKKA